MGEKGNSNSSKWSMEEREKILATGTLEQKKEAFKDDEELMRETTKFVSEVIETAATEASKRKVHSEVNLFHISNHRSSRLFLNYLMLRFSRGMRMKVRVTLEKITRYW